ncbi:sensor histidine kinase [Georgenia halophila]|uniref:histidine kinase n=1 Tax=Georgenia halophila TaxID=620889 RepID=A0ABP8LC88_9MICO
MTSMTPAVHRAGPAATTPARPVADPAASPAFLRAPFDRRSWLRYGYLWVAVLMAPFALAYALVSVVLTVGLAVTVVGLFVGGTLIVGARGWATTYRGMASKFLGNRVPEVPPFRRGRGFWRGLGSMLGDSAGWRALLFMFVMFPLSVVGFVTSTAVLVASLGAVTHSIWGRYLPEQQAGDGSWHRGAQLGPDWFVDTPARQLAFAGIGIVLFFVWPWIPWLFTQVAGLLSQSLLGPTRESLRVADLEQSRAGAVEDADARLRRIERDLHDGTQARLVAVAMQLGEAKDHLDSGTDPDQVSELVGTAHASTKDALVELRELARGIHPPVLDDGLGVALDTLAARSPLPVTMDVDAEVADRGRLAPAVESIVYFCVAELVTNAAKHARASGVYVLVERHDGDLRVRVRDDGRGGAAVTPPESSGHRSGLSGLAERVHAVDGRLDVSSPAGGPTVVTVTLPENVRP